MSMKLVRKFLQQDDEPAVNSSEHQQASKKRKRRRRRDDQEADLAATQDEILQATVHGMMYLDRAMTTFTGKSDSKNGAMKRRMDEAKKAKKRRKAILENDTMVGNSRSSSSQMRLPSEPTFNKKRYKKEQEEKRLKDIAKLLKAQKKK